MCDLALRILSSLPSCGSQAFNAFPWRVAVLSFEMPPGNRGTVIIAVSRSGTEIGEEAANVDPLRCADRWPENTGPNQLFDILKHIGYCNFSRHPHYRTTWKATRDVYAGPMKPPLAHDQNR